MYVAGWTIITLIFSILHQEPLLGVLVKTRMLWCWIICVSMGLSFYFVWLGSYLLEWNMLIKVYKLIIKIMTDWILIFNNAPIYTIFSCVRSSDNCASINQFNLRWFVSNTRYTTTRNLPQSIRVLCDLFLCNRKSIITCHRGWTLCQMDRLQSKFY